jgi:hypothetical protein
MEGCFFTLKMTGTGRKTEDAVISIPAQEKKQIEPENLSSVFCCTIFLAL